MPIRTGTIAWRDDTVAVSSMRPRWLRVASFILAVVGCNAVQIAHCGTSGTGGAASSLSAPWITDVRLSPDGLKVLAIAIRDHRRVLVVVDLAVGSAVEPLATEASNQLLDECDWVTTTRIVCSVFVFQSNRDGGTYPRRRVVRLVAVEHDGANPLVLLDDPPRRPPRIGGGPRGAGIPLEDMEHLVVSRLLGEAQHVLVSASREASPYTSVYRVNIQDGRIERVVRWQQGILFWHADWQGRVRLGTGWYAAGRGVPNPREPWRGPTAVARSGAGEDATFAARFERLDVSRTATRVSQNELGGPRVLGFSKAGRDVYYLARVEGADRISLWVADSSTLEPRQQLAQDGVRDMHGWAIGAEGCGTVGFAHGRGDFTWVDDSLQTAVATVEKLVAERVVHVPSMSADCGRLVVATMSRSMAVRYYLLDRDTGAVRHLGGRGLIGGARSSTVRRTAEYNTRDGLAFPVTLTTPVATHGGPLPIIVLLDYSVGGSNPTNVDRWPYRFAGMGYVVVEPAYRGARGYGHELHLAGLTQRGLKLQEDIADAVSWVAAQGIGNADRVCFVGRGRGGHMALAAALAFTADGDQAHRCVAAYAVLDAQGTKRDVHEPLDIRLCAWFPCTDWMRWAAPETMRRAARGVPDARPRSVDLYRSPVIGADHPGFPVLIQSDASGLVHERDSRRYRADVKRLGFIERVDGSASRAEAAFLDQAAELFSEVLTGLPRTEELGRNADRVAN